MSVDKPFEMQSLLTPQELQTQASPLERTVDGLRNAWNEKLRLADVAALQARDRAVEEATALSRHGESASASTVLRDRKTATDLLRDSAIRLQNYGLAREQALVERKPYYTKFVDLSRAYRAYEVHPTPQPPVPSAPPPPPGPLSSSSSGDKDDGGLPPANSIDFAQEMLLRFPEWKLPPPSKIIDPKACDQDPAKAAIAPYQWLAEKWASPGRTDRGLALWWAAGTGKTRAGWLAILRNVHAAIHKLIMVLVPNDNVMTVWMRDLAPLCATMLQEPCPTLQGDGATRVLTFANGVEVWFQIMTQVMTEPRRRHPLLQPKPDYVLPASYDADVYKTLSSAMKTRLVDDLAKQRASILNSHVAVPKGLVIVDEAHNLVNPIETATTAPAALTCLAWLNAIRAASAPTRIMFLSATPFIEDDRPQDLFHYLHALRPVATVSNTTLAFEGVVRRVRPATDDPDPLLTQAFLAADLVETQKTYDAMFTGDGDWQPGKQDAFELAYSALVSRVTLENDPSRYPQVAEKQPVLQLSEDGKSLETVPGQVSPLGMIVRVSMIREASKAYDTALKSDLRAYNDRRLRTSACKDRPPAAACLDYGNPATLTGVQKGFGMRGYKGIWPRKLRALQLKLSDTQARTMRHFVFSSAKTYREYGKSLVPYLKTVERFNVWGMLDVWDFLIQTQGLTKSTKTKVDDDRLKRAVDTWYKDHTPAERVVFFGNSATQEALKNALGSNGANARDWIKGFMLLVFNDPRNAGGRYVRVFVGDRKAKEGISLLQTVMVHEMEPSPNRTMYVQSTARARRNCSFKGLPPGTMLNIIFYVSTFPPGSASSSSSSRVRRRRAAPAAGGDGDEKQQQRKTNDEYQYDRLVSGKWPIDQIVTSLFDAAMDCRLFRQYNGDAGVRCMGQPPDPPLAPPPPPPLPAVQLPLIETSQGVVPVITSDQVCIIAPTGSAAYVQLLGREQILEWTPASVQPVGSTSAPCERVLDLPPANKFDVQISHALEWLTGVVGDLLPRSPRDRIALGMLLQPQLEQIALLAPWDRTAMFLITRDRSDRIGQDQKIAWIDEPAYVAWRLSTAIQLLYTALVQLFSV